MANNNGIDLIENVQFTENNENTVGILKARMLRQLDRIETKLQNTARLFVPQPHPLASRLDRITKKIITDIYGQAMNSFDERYLLRIFRVIESLGKFMDIIPLLLGHLEDELLIEIELDAKILMVVMRRLINEREIECNQIVMESESSGSIIINRIFSYQALIPHQPAPTVGNNEAMLSLVLCLEIFRDAWLTLSTNSQLAAVYDNVVHKAIHTNAV